MNVNEVRSALRAFSSRHKITFRRLGARQSQILELGALVGTAQHFKAAGFHLGFHNPDKLLRFKVKSGTRGHPCDYSRIICSKGTTVAELHANVLARGAHDRGVYCVDVGIVQTGAIPLKRPVGKWEAIENAALLTFVEAKKLVIYPMLLAQFVGIVHEIKPEFLKAPGPDGFGKNGPMPPTLVALGGFSSNSTTITDSFRARGFGFLIVQLFDFQLARCRKNPTQSPFYQAEPENFFGKSEPSSL